jgi:hypothetical protein
MEVHLEWQKFRTDELKYSVLNLLHSQYETFYAVDIIN